MAMELPDEAILYDYGPLLIPEDDEAWTTAAEMRAQHFLSPGQLKDLMQSLQQCKSQVAAEREMGSEALKKLPPTMQPLEPGFIDLPRQLLDQFRRQGEASALGRVIATAEQWRQEADHVVLLGMGGLHLGCRALFEALRSTHHNQLPAETRLGIPRIYFAGHHSDNDSLQDLLDLLQITCVDPEVREERWAVLAISKTGLELEPAIALRVFRREALEYYGLRSEWLTRLFSCVTGTDSALRALFHNWGFEDSGLHTIPANVGERFGVFSPAGLLPAAIMGLDVRALLLGAAAMTKRFLEEPFERNPVLQFAGINHLMAQERNKRVRGFSIWSQKLEPVGLWYDYLVTSSLCKRGRGPIPLASVQTRDVGSWGQQQHEGPRDQMLTNLVLKAARSVPIQVQMADHDQDGLNAISRKNLMNVQSAAHEAINQSHFDAGRPTADLILPALTEHTLGQLMQMLMLSTAVEARLIGVNPYSQPTLSTCQQLTRELLIAQSAAQ